MKALLFASIALAPLAPALAQTDTPLTPRITGTQLDVSATGEAHHTADIATISAGVVVQASTAAKALADNAAQMTKTIDAVRQAGVAARDIQTQSIRLEPQYRNSDNQPPVLTGYQASNSIVLRLRDIGRAGSVLDTLVAAGANQIDGPNLSVDHPEAALDEARTAAIATARARAELYARAAGLHVARIVRISEGGSEEAPIRPMGMIMVTARRKQSTPIEPGEQTLSATVAVTFELQ